MYNFCVCTWLYAPPPPFLWAFSSPTSCRLSRCGLPMATPIRIVIVGDVHDCWSFEEDTQALRFLKPDLVLFTGDFGNENVDLVKSISNLNFPKAVILGNHDAWRTYKFSSSGKEKDGVQKQLKFLGEEHVGYRRMDFPILNLSVVGGRPFSCGGHQLYRKKLLVARYGVDNMDASARRIYEAAVGTPAGHSVILLAHNGPTGLGSNVDDICGRDWYSDGGDHGDPDLAKAVSEIQATTALSIKLVVFGHMHKELADGKGLRKMFVVGDDGVIYLNGAIVPRVKTVTNEQGNAASMSSCDNASTLPSVSLGTLRAFTVVDILDGNVEKIAETWVAVGVNDVESEDEIVLFSKDSRV